MCFKPADNIFALLTDAAEIIIYDFKKSLTNSVTELGHKWSSSVEAQGATAVAFVALSYWCITTAKNKLAEVERTNPPIPYQKRKVQVFYGVPTIVSLALAVFIGYSMLPQSGP